MKIIELFFITNIIVLFFITVYYVFFEFKNKFKKYDKNIYYKIYIYIIVLILKYIYVF